MNLVQNMLKHISRVHENHSNDPIKLIVHLLISFGSDFLFSFGDNKNKQLVFLRGLNVISLALEAVIIESHLSLESFVNQGRKHKMIESLFGKWLTALQYNPLTRKTQFNQVKTLETT